MVLVAELVKENERGHRVLLAPEPLQVQRISEHIFLKKFPICWPILYQRWFGGKYGTVYWSIFLFTKTNSFDVVSVPGVFEKVDLLCSTTGAHRVKKMHKWIENLSQIDPTLRSFSRQFWMKNQQRLNVSLPLLEHEHCLG